MADKQLEQLSKEIADSKVEVKDARKDWLSATDPQQRADLKEVYEYAKETEKGLLSSRAEVVTKLPSAGEHTLLL